ncbi:DUF481 domain-containing protein [Pseudomonas syringae]|uniref:DUF481 domain-containing protein n=1 Tax=Pseudomonas syringae TaxID=317 RepID=UPI00028D406F|nr:DUF481 domain-containing protein [Pseudomonas syringae]EKG35788.1 Peptide chain release factor RF-3 [Pseudomonas syringae pv. avellanae str. ISPaVe037]
MRIKAVIFLSTAYVSLAAPSALADSVVLKNGDRLSGNIIFLDGANLLLNTAYGGDITIRKDQIETMESKQALLVRQSGQSDGVVEPIQAASQGAVRLAEGGKSSLVSLNNIDKIMKPKPILTAATWTGNVDLALDIKRAETDTDNINIAAKTSLVSGLWRHSANAQYVREDNDNVTSTDNWNAEYTLDRFLTEKWFWEGGLSYKKDQVEDLRTRRQIGTGPGYQFWDDQLGKFSVVGLLNRTQYGYADGGGNSFYSTSLRWDYNRFLVGRKLEVFASGELARPLSDVADYAYDSELGLRYKVTEWASLNLKYEHEVVGGMPDGNDLDSARYTAGVGVTW